MQTGLVSVTFRQLSPAEIVKLVSEAGLDCVEWGGDIHCPPGDPDKARDVRRLTKDAGLSVVSYGSYYYAGEENNCEVASLIETADALGTDNIRIWAGKKGSDVAEPEYRANLVADTVKLAKMAAVKGITISFEYHCNTLTDCGESTVRLLSEINMPNVCTYWQVHGNIPFDENIRDIKKLVEMKKLKNLHIFSYNGNDRTDLTYTAKEWAEYIKAAAPAKPALLMEFVKGNDPAQFIRDAATLKTLL